MSRKDFYHEHVVAALQTLGWRIVHENFELPFFDSRVKIDILAELVETDGTKTLVVVEVKSFRERKTYVSELQKSLGQYLLYRDVLRSNGLPYQLLLAVPESVFLTLFQDKVVKPLFARQQVELITFNPVSQEIVRWNP